MKAARLHLKLENYTNMEYWLFHSCDEGCVMAAPQFQRRLVDACDRHPDCPPLHQGRQVWLRKRLSERGVKVSTESVRKWLSGEVRPREEKGRALADVLGADVGWLLIGSKVEFSDDFSVPGVETRANDAALDVPIALRPSTIVRVSGIPFDLTKPEAQKIANIILAHASVE
jgi:hypothetical protein